MDVKVRNICRYILIALMALGVVFGVIYMFKGEAFAGTFITVGYFFIGGALLTLLSAPVLNMVENPAGLKNILFVVVLALAVVLVAWLISGNTFTDAQLVDKGINATISHVVSAGVNLFYIVFGGAVASIVFAVVYNAVKK